MEPEEEEYLPSLRLLLDAPGSRYRHVPYDILEGSSYEQILDDGLLPEQGVEVNTNTINRSLLVLATVATFPVKVYKRGMTVAQHLINAFCSPGSRHAISMIVRRLGAVRLLVWVHDHEKEDPLPRTVIGRDAFNVLLDQAYKIQEVAGSGETNVRSPREPNLILASAERVAATMIASGSQIAPDRRNSVHLAVLSRLAESTSHPASRSGLSSPDLAPEMWKRFPWMSELAALEALHARGEIVLNVSPRHARSDDDAKQPFDARAQRLLRLRTEMRIKNNTKESEHLLANLIRQRDDLELSVAGGINPACETQSAEERMDALTKEILEKERNWPSRKVSRALGIADDTKAVASHPPLLTWDRREIEPLLVRENEFSPTSKLALLDFQPRESYFNSHSDNLKHLRAKFISHLFVSPSSTVAKALEGIAPGASEALIPQIPSLQDPSQGGTKLSDNLRVRMLTSSMIEDLVQAFAKWPFRPVGSESGFFGSLESSEPASNKFRL